MENNENVIFANDDVQICKPLSMVNNRIEYFLRTKRGECNDRNTRLYCNLTSEDNLSSSRICSTAENKRLETSECFVKSTKVHNSYSAPCNIDSASKNNCILSNNTNSIKPDVCERVSNIEKCLNIITSHTFDNRTIYEKLKLIENQVLNLQMKLINNDGNHLPNVFTNDQYIEIINENLKTRDHTLGSTSITENEHNKLTLSNVMPKKSKYTAEEIKQLIINIQNNKD